jgi:uncharacterized protein YlxW (UPF0749 family)
MSLTFRARHSGRPAPKPFSTQLLVDLVLDPRDPAYEVAAARRAGRTARRWYDRPAAVLGCLLAGFLLAVAYVHTNRGAPEAARVHGSLVDRVRAAEQRGGRLSDVLAQLSERLNGLRRSALSGAAAQRLSHAQQLAGQVAVTGPGLRVTLAEPPGSSASAQPGQGAARSGNILTDRDVRDVVNQLWSDGAEAIAVNGIRLTPTSAIRLAGDAVLVDFQPINSPYTIDAIGSADRLATSFAASTAASRYQTLVGVDGIGFSFTEQRHLQLPAAPASVLRYARPAGAK